MYTQFAVQFTIVWLLQVSTPGPNFVRISHSALEHSRAVAFAVAAGSATGNLAWCGLAVLGAAAAANSGVVGLAIRIAGAIYLFWLGCKFVFRSASPAIASTANSPSNVAIGYAVRSGIMTSLANPHTALFFATYFVVAGLELSPVELLLLGGPIVATTTLLWYALVIAVLTHPTSRRKYLMLRRPIDFLFGCLLIFAAIKLISAVAGG